MMATKPTGGNERLDAHLCGELLKEPPKRGTLPGMPKPRLASVASNDDETR